MNAAAAVARHYAPDPPAALIARIDAALAPLGPDPLDPALMATMDHFHVGGARASALLAELAQPTVLDRVLDAGCGLGGPARWLAATCGCHVTGVDVTPAFVAAANHLAHRTALAHHVDFTAGDLTALALPDGAFSLVWTEHVAMNIADRALLYRELRRVTAPGGRLALFDILAGEGEPIYPMPWADTAAESHLLTEPATRAVLAASGWHVTDWRDLTAQALQWFSAPPPPGPSLMVVMGERMARAAPNIARNLAERRIRAVMALAGAA